FSAKISPEKMTGGGGGAAATTERSDSAKDSTMFITSYVSSR
ncbi:hypothetical protein A2U01_0092086, partial [Trifolium medium]|nr:hypothetical protein [Trifolium medium]